MNGKCKAQRRAAEWYCALCLKTWDADDDQPPPCPEKANKVKDNYYQNTWRAKRLNGV